MEIYVDLRRKTTMTKSRKKAGILTRASRFLWLWLLLGGAYLPMLAQPNVGAALSATKMLIGDQVTLTITASYKPPVEVQSIGFDALNREPRLEVLRAERFEREGENGLRIAEVEIKLTCFDSGYYFIPPIPIAYTLNGRQDTVRTNQLGLEVGTIPVGPETTQIQPIKGIIEEPVNFRDLLPYLIGAALVLIVAGGLVFYFWQRKKPEPPPVPPRKVPAHLLAQEQLDALEQQKLWQQGEVKQYHSQLTHILRQYLERRYGIKALEQTTEEILQSLEPVSREDAFDNSHLRELLRTVDLVKFAKAAPPASFHAEAMEKVRGFVEQTKDEALEIEVPEKDELET